MSAVGKASGVRLCKGHGGPTDFYWTAPLNPVPPGDMDQGEPYSTAPAPAWSRVDQRRLISTYVIVLVERPAGAHRVPIRRTDEVAAYLGGCTTVWYSSTLDAISSMHHGKPGTMTFKDDPLLTYDDAAEYLGVSKSALQHWVPAGRIDCVRINRLVRFRRSALDAFIEANTDLALKKPKPTRKSRLKGEK